jgi:hypothetical protein
LVVECVVVDKLANEEEGEHPSVEEEEEDAVDVVGVADDDT